MILPTATDELIKVPNDLAREIDSQYVVTYTPKARFTTEPPGTMRHVEVVSRRVGLYVRSRRSYLSPR